MNYVNVQVFSVKEGRKLTHFNEAQSISVKNDMVTITGVNKYKKRTTFMAPKTEVFLEFDKLLNKEEKE